MKQIPLTQGKFAVVDDEDYERTIQRRWYARQTKSGTWYACRRRIGTKKLHMHRFILNCPDGLEVDHKNGDGLDNRKDNLRICTRA